MKTLVLGLGNPILSDDGIGPQIAKELEGRLDQQEVTVAETSLAGLSLLDLLTGYDKAIIVDAIQTVGGKPGQIYQLDPEAFNATRHASSPHDINFATALEFGNRLGLALPQQIVIFAIEVHDASTFSEECTPKVREAIPVCVEMIIQELKGDHDAQFGNGSRHIGSGAQRS
ncbi:hydrogenase maturation protease [Chloroflexota bacterium]